MAFEDHFSAQAAEYARFRPRYPPELVAHVAALAPGHGLALDLATGNGQAAIDLAAHFDLVLASDASAAQLAHATAHGRVRYLWHAAERLPYRDRSADLVACAQAAHWFDFDRFWPEVRRVLRPGGICALWTYGKLRIDPATDALVDSFHSGVVGPWWPPERRHVEAGYRTLPFALAELATPAFELTTRWTTRDVLDYLGTWSAVQRRRAATGADPLPGFAQELARVHAADARLTVRWPLHLRIGRL